MTAIDLLKPGESKSDASSAKPITIQPPFLVYFGGAKNKEFAKTGFGLIQWRREDCVGQKTCDGSKYDTGVRDVSVAEAVELGARSLIVGVAPIGGGIPPEWMPDILEAAKLGMDVVAGLHQRLNSIPELVEAAEHSGARLIDVRVPPEGLPVGTGRPRSGMRLLTVGTDCSVGKKYTALSIAKEMKRRGMKVDFRATGQTGIMIAGSGIPIDAVVSDFISGAAECVSPNADADHWDVIEGQGSLSHPGYAAVSLGLLHGSQPDALVLCHDAPRTHIRGLGNEDFPILPFTESIEQNLSLARRINPAARFVGMSVNTSALPADQREAYLRDCEEQTGLPAADPILDGPSKIIDVLEKEVPHVA